MKRVLAVLVGAGIAVGGGVAWAHPGGPNREAAKACLAEARAANPEADWAALRQAVRQCLEAQGISRPEPTPEQQARREALRECRARVHAGHPDAEGAELRRLVRECVQGG